MKDGERQYKFYPQGVTDFAGYMNEKEALIWLKENKDKHISGLEMIETMTAEQAWLYLESLKNEKS